MEEKTVLISFTKEELVVLNNILDFATKVDGLKIAETTLYFSKRLKEALDKINQ